MNFLTIALLVFSSFSVANESYQREQILGDWRSLDFPFYYDDLRITETPQSNNLLQYCAPWPLETESTCEETKNYTGIGTYEESSQSIRMIEGNSSPTPNYLLQVNPDNSNELIRDWGREKILYFRINSAGAI